MSSFCSHVRSHLLLPWNEVVPVREGWRTAPPFHTPALAYTKVASPSASRRTLLRAFERGERMGVLSYKHCLGMNISVTARCNTIDIFMSLIMTALLRRACFVVHDGESSFPVGITAIFNVPYF